MESVKVIVRLRPQEENTDKQDLSGSCILSVEDTKLTIVDPLPPASHSVEGNNAHDFTFDKVFGTDASQAEVFEQVKPLVHAAVEGYTTTVFGYGSTGAGKTHTISGADTQPGIIPQAVSLLFERLAVDAASGSDRAFMVFLTYVEIYNNKFYNLLEKSKIQSREGRGQTNSKNSDGSGGGGGERTSEKREMAPARHTSKIEVREHPSRGVFLAEGGGEGGRNKTGSRVEGGGLRVPVTSAAAVMKLIEQGIQARTTAATSLNDRSSRSHAILILEIEANEECTLDMKTGVGTGLGSGARAGVGLGVTTDRLTSGYQRRTSMAEYVSIGKLQVIDLAGSERVTMSGAEGRSLAEAQNINLSLSLLGDVLNALSKYHRAATKAMATKVAREKMEADLGGESVLPPPPTSMERPFIPYRNSKLTYLLKDSLGGNCKTLMVCAIRAAPAFFHQTMTSLR
ncbi:unnamed protein product [Choristocarpus tenellus]